MVDMAVYAAAGEEAHDVQGLAGGLRVIHGLDVRGVFKELAVFYLLRHLG